MKIKHLVLILSLFAVSCESDFDYYPINYDQIPVVNCLFTPDSVFNVFLGQTKEIYSTQSSILEIEDIYILDNDSNKIVLNKIDETHYQSLTTAQLGKNYKIIINSKKYGQITAQSYIPSELPKIDTVLNLNNYYTFNLYFNDISNKTNYYEINTYLKEICGIDTTIRNYEAGITKINYPENSFFGMFSDINFQNNEINVQLECSGRNNEGDSIIFGVKNLSKEYFLFYKSIHQYQESFDVFNSFESFTNMIFVKKYTKIYTNIEGGIGIFAGYNNNCFYVILSPQRPHWKSSKTILTTKKLQTTTNKP